MRRTLYALVCIAVCCVGLRQPAFIPALFTYRRLSRRISGEAHRIERDRSPVHEHCGQKNNIAMDLLDCLTSPVDDSDPQYSFEKDMRRDSLLAANDYTVLKAALRRKGLRTSGDKVEMITRLLLHDVDPSIQYDEM
jgi:hypothetical protein